MSDGGSGPRGRPSLITAAQPSYDQQFRTRRRRYVIMMAMRVPFLVAAAALYRTPWLALTLILVSIPLPWCAVLIANDGPARKPVKARRGSFNNQLALPGPRREVVESEPESAPTTQDNQPH